MTTKTCSRCGKTKELTTEFFYKESKNKDGFQYQCKECKQSVDKSYRKMSVVHKDYQKSPSFVFSQLKYQAQKRNMPFKLDKDYYIQNLAYKPCFYCGEEDTKHWIDRYINDHTVGYTHENSVPCCEICNKMKISLDPTVFLNHCKKIVRHNL